MTRKLPSARLVARLLASDDDAAAEVLSRFAHDARLRTSGAVTLAPVPADSPVALADRGLVAADPLAAFLLGVNLEARDRPLRRLERPEHEPGRVEATARLRALLHSDPTVPILVAGTDAGGVARGPCR